MSIRWKRIVAVLGVAAMVLGQNGVISASAAELPTEANPAGEEISEEVSNNEGDESETGVAADGEVTDTATDETGETGVTTESGTPEDGTVAGETTENETPVEGAETEAGETDGTGVAAEEDGISLLSDETSDVQVVTNLRWSEETPGQIVFYNPNEGDVSFVAHYFQDGSLLGTWTTSASTARDVTLPIYMDIFESATYTVQVEVFGYGEEKDYDLSSGRVSEVSPGFVYTRPDAQIAAPGNIKWDSTGMVTWDEVENAASYWSYLYVKSGETYRSRGGFGSSSTYENYADKLAEGEEYYTRVRAVSSNINLYANSDYSDYIPFLGSIVVEGVNNKLDEAMAGVSASVEAAVEAVKSAFGDATSKGELQVAMQTDAGTQDKIRGLEEKYMEEKGLTTSVASDGDTGIDDSKVSLLGAALNATESGSVKFNMSKPDEETQNNLITHSRFTNAIVLNLELEGAGITKGAPLDVPVTVTMPVPEGMDACSLTILHYNDDGQTYEHLNVRQNADGTISFTVLHFSNFVFGVSENPAGSNNGSSSNGTGSESGAVSDDGTGTVYVAAWKPTTPDEIKRYSAVGKEKVSYEADAANAYAVTIKNAMQGKLCFDSFEAVRGDYTIGRTYNIFPANDRNAYRTDKEIKITLTIPKALQAPNREYKMICVTENGLPIVLNDLDKEAGTITFKTNAFHAYALVYKDVKASK